MSEHNQERLKQALSLAAQGFHVFPVLPDQKEPYLKQWPERATRDEKKIRQWWSDANFNIGISTGRFAEDKALLVVDVDNKKGKDGDDTLLTLELEGYDFPPTLEQKTPSGGRHLIYLTDRPVKQGTNVLGAGLDIRSSGGYIVGPGSSVRGKPYSQISGRKNLVPAPQWLVDSCGKGITKHQKCSRTILPNVDQRRAENRALLFLQNLPVAVEGERNQKAYVAANKIKDLGCNENKAYLLMSAHWLCEPPLDESELRQAVHSAYTYGQEPAGILAPEAAFTEQTEVTSISPLEKMNKEYAYTNAGGGHIIHETEDEKGNPALVHLPMKAFHNWFKNKTITIGKKCRPLSEVWMEWPTRRSFAGLVFAPGRTVSAQWYNLWRGFSVVPLAPDEPVPVRWQRALDAFLEHTLQNVCCGDATLRDWLLGYFAHMVQKPEQKPLVALVFKGRKGTGKNALVERIGALFASHFIVADDDRYLLSNFNGHLENCLFMVLDEAAWAGDKRAEGRLKGLITGTSHNIERKGCEPYKVDNLTRIAIIGNDDWLVPATHDERRFAVFNVGDGRKQDRSFFREMREGMEAGGYRLLLRYLLDFDIQKIDVNEAPQTQGLIDQKHASLEPWAEWWFECLRAGCLVGHGVTSLWPDNISTVAFREALGRYAHTRNIKSRLPNEGWLGRYLSGACPGLGRKLVRQKDEGQHYVYLLPSLEQARKEWESYMGGSMSWT